MRLLKKDTIATVAVAAAVAAYLLWLADVAPPGLGGVRATGLVVLGLGFVASAVAVVPGFDDLLHGSRVYLVGTSVLGLVALVAGIVMLVTADSAALAVLTLVLVILWAIATMHHEALARTGPPATTAQIAPHDYWRHAA